MADYLDPVVVELEGRDRKLLDTLTRAKAEVRRFTADVGRMNATIKVDVKLKDGALAEVRRRVAESPAAKLKVDLQLGAGQRDRLRAQLEGRPITANVRPVMDQTALRRVRTVLRELGRRIDVQIRPQIDTRAQLRVQSRLDRLSRDRTVTIRTRVVGDQNHLAGGAAAALGQGGAGAAASSGGGSGALWGTLGVLGASALPSIGALVPMLAGAATAAATLKMGLSGVGKAADLAGKDSKKYHEALKAMSPAQREFTKTLVDVKGQFHDFGKDIQKAMLPGFTAALKAAGPVVKILGKSMTELGGTFGDAARGFGRLMKDAGFQRDFAQVLKLGNQFVGELTRSMGPFVRSLLDFGAASGPTLKAFSDGIGGLLSKGLPGMFQGLKQGIPGAASMLNGLFSAVDDLLGGLGRLSGEMGKTLGPVLGETFRLLGGIGAGAMDALAGALDKLQPVFRDFTFGLKTIRDVGALIGPTLKDTAMGIAGAFLPIGDSVNNAVGPLQRLNQWVAENKIGILEASRVFGVAMIDLTGAAINAAPIVIHAFRFISQAFLESVGVVVGGAAKLFGWMPGIGPKLKKASSEFDSFKGTYLSGLDAAERKATEFAASSGPKLSAGKLKLNINNWQSQIEAAKAKLKTVPPSKQAAIKATIADLTAKVASAKAKLNSIDGKTATTWIYTNVQTNYVPSATRKGSLHDALARGGPVRGYASGGALQAYPDGGYIQGPGSGTSDSIVTILGSGNVARTSNTEFVVNAKETAKHRRLLELINAGLLPKFAKGGLTQDAKEARGQLSGSFGISSFGRMAGYQRTPFERELAASSDINALVSSLNQFRGEIKKAFSGRTESSLLRQLDKAGKSLISYDKQLSKVTSSLASAKSKLDDLKTSAAQLKSSVASSIMQGANVVTQAPQEGFALRSVDIVNNMNAQLQKASAFSAQLQQLKKRGLSADLLEQIAEAGVDQGGATAAALAGASSAQIKQLNQMQSQLKKSANAAGSAVSDSMYGAGIKAAEGLVKGLEKKQKAIEAAMLRIAKSMEKAIKHALKIKSPSQVMAGLGDYTALGLAHGIARSSKHAVIAARGMAMSVQQGATLTGTPTRAGVPVMGARGGGTVVNYHYHFTIEGNAVTIDRLAKDVETAFLRRGMRNPLTYPAYQR